MVLLDIQVEALEALVLLVKVTMVALVVLTAAAVAAEQEPQVMLDKQHQTVMVARVQHRQLQDHL